MKVVSFTELLMIWGTHRHAGTQLMLDSRALVHCVYVYTNAKYPPIFMSHEI